MKAGQRILNERGALMVEAATSIGIFLFILVSGIQLLLTVYQRSVVGYALSDAGRYAILGVPETESSRRALIKQTLIDRSAQYGVTLSATDISICPKDNHNCTPSEENAGKGGQWIYISARGSANALSLLPKIPYKREIIVKNEPF